MKISDLSSHDSLLILLKGKTFLLLQHPVVMFLPLFLQVFHINFIRYETFQKYNYYLTFEN